MKKQFFAVQNDWPCLAALRCSYDSHSSKLSVFENESIVLDASTTSESGLLEIDEYFSTYLSKHEPSASARHPQIAPVRIVRKSSGRGGFPDRDSFHISILNLSTLRALSEMVGRPLDIRRFRGNIIVDGLPAWSEFEWIGCDILLGDSKVSVKAKIGRCSNINIDPETGDSDAAVLTALAISSGCGAFGVLATVKAGGIVAIGDEVTVSGCA